MGLLRTLSSAQWDPSTDPAVALERARALLAADLWRLDLPSPSVTINDLALAPALAPAGGASLALDPMPIDRVFCAQVQAPELVLSLCLPLSGGQVLPAELVGRVHLPAPATALLRPTGWEPHPDQADDPVACAFIDALNARPDLSLPLQWGPADQQEPDWAIQLIADAGDSCLLVVRTAPLGERGQYAGLEAFLDILPLVRDMIRGWSLQCALPAGVAADCVALRELPQGEVWLPDWSYDEPRVFTPDSLEEGGPQGDPEDEPEEDPDDVPTELAYTPRVVNLAEVEFSEAEEAVLVDEEPSAVTFDGPVVEIDDDDGYFDEDEADEEPSAIIVQPPPLGPTASPPSPALAAGASLLLPGLGQILCGQVGRGAVIMTVAVFTLGLGGLLNLYMAVDAWKLASRLREGSST